MRGNYILGQYLATGSLLHQMDGRSKFVGSLILTSIVFWNDTWAQHLLMTFVVFLLGSISKIPFHKLGAGLRLPLWFALGSFIIHTLTTPGQELYQVLGLTVTLEGLIQGMLIGWRLLLLAGIAIILTATTSPLALTSALEVLLRPLEKIKLPVRQLALMMGLALRFIPIIAEEGQMLRQAQLSRGGYIEDGPWVLRIKTLYAMIVPLIVLSFKRADLLAQAMEARCFGGQQATRIQVPPLSYRDYLGLGFCGSILVFCYLIR